MYVKRDGAEDQHKRQEMKVLAGIEEEINNLRIKPRKLVLGEYKGCGACKFADWCSNKKIYKEKIKVVFKNNERADNGSRFVTVFSRGETVTAEAHIVGNTVLCATASSNFYDGYTDFISLDNIEIIQ